MADYIPIISDEIHNALIRIHEELAEAGATDEQIAEACQRFWDEVRGKVLH